MTDTIDARFLVRRGTRAMLAAVNEVPLAAEIVYESDQGLSDGNYKIKIGDGITHYNSLPYVNLGVASLPLTTKGDLLSYNGSALVRVPVGAVGQVPTADPSAAAGWSWQTPTGGGGGSANINADTHPASTPNANDEFEFGTSIDTTGGRRSGATAWTNFGAVTSGWAVGQGSLCFTPFITNVANFNGYTQPITGTTWAYTCKVQGNAPSNSSNIGLFLATATGTAGKIFTIALNSTTISVQKWTNSTTFSAVAASTTFNSVFGSGMSPVLYLRISYDGTNLMFWASHTGIEGTFTKIYQETPATFFGSVPTLIGIGGQQSSTVTVGPYAVFDWFRKTA